MMIDVEMEELDTSAALAGRSPLLPSTTSQLVDTAVARSARRAVGNQARYKCEADWSTDWSSSYTQLHTDAFLLVASSRDSHSHAHRKSSLDLTLRLYLGLPVVCDFLIFILLCRFNVLFLKRFWCVMRLAFPRVCSKSLLLFLILIFTRSAG